MDGGRERRRETDGDRDIFIERRRVEDGSIQSESGSFACANKATFVFIKQISANQQSVSVNSFKAHSVKAEAY